MYIVRLINNNNSYCVVSFNMGGQGIWILNNSK